LNPSPIRQSPLPFSSSVVGKQDIAEARSSRGAPREIGVFARRTFDVTCAAAGLVFLTPVFALIAAAIKWEGGGPVIYTQTRVGKGLRRFRLFKFRSMFAGSSDATVLTGPGDPRVTGVGHYLRKYKLDELPQLFNVLKGDMQLVGVRPQTERFVDVFPFEYSVLLQEPPGITGLASLIFRNEEQMFQPGSIEKQYLEEILPEKLRLAMEYRSRRTFFSDLDIICRTVLGLKSPSLR
jgi:lipopolysaccharide/colanic/teichoic acid biosynthesis glycosyltransferase